MPSFGFVRTGTSGTAIDAFTQIGEVITMPAGGPFIIYAVYGNVAKVTTVPAESTGGVLKLDALSGDLTPDPAPGLFPLIGAFQTSGANNMISPNPLNIWPTRFTASGKATLALSVLNDDAVTTASQVIAGILFGTEVPQPTPHIFLDSVQSEFASAAEQTIGSIVLAEKAKKITGILAVCNKPTGATAGEEIVVSIRLDSADVKIQPAQYPCNVVFNASDGTGEGGSGMPQTQFIPVDIPMLPGSTINVFATSTRSVTANVSVRVFLAYE